MRKNAKMGTALDAAVYDVQRRIAFIVPAALSKNEIAHIGRVQIYF
jgi:hypothetical protein